MLKNEKWKDKDTWPSHYAQIYLYILVIWLTIDFLVTGRGQTGPLIVLVVEFPRDPWTRL